jgi:signal peptidase II
MPWARKTRYFWPLAVVILLTDCATKRVAEAALTPAHVPHAVLGDLVRLTLTYNPGAQ